MPHFNCRRAYWTAALLLVFVLVRPAHGQLNLSGVVNEYTKVLAQDACRNAVLVATKGSLAKGDRVVLIQMKGATIDRTDAPQYGTITSYGTAGAYEFATVDSIAAFGAPWVRFTNTFVNTYDMNGSVQLIRVPSSKDVIVSGTVLAAPWSDQTGTGGVLAIEATGTLTLNAPLEASGKGFVGGDRSLASPSHSEIHYVYDYSTGLGAQKGEGITNSIPDADAGRGVLANGGGGGNTYNAGGGGGSNGGAGGIGGDESSNSPQLANGGLGGWALSIVPTRLYCGGGGGGGQQSDGKGSSGANGGGIILIRANTLTGASSVLANGANAGNAVQDGAGGGGAGGSILLDVKQITGSLTFQARGGDGGSVTTGVNPQFCYAPGGGAGGGLITTTGVAVPASAQVDRGHAGFLSGSTGTCNGTNYGAVDGTDGVTSRAGVVTESTTPMIYPHVLNTTYKMCEGKSVQIGAANGTKYTWTPATGLDNPSSPNPIASPAKTTTYIVDIENGTCLFRDSLVVSVVPTPDTTITGVTTLCLGSTETYRVPKQAGATYTWSVSTGATTTTPTNLDSVTVNWAAAGPASITVTVDNGNCTASSTTTITIGNQVVPLIVGGSTACEGDTLVLSTKDPYDGYLWSTNETTPSIKVWKSGTYSVTVSTLGGCNGTSQTFPVTVNPKPVIAVTAPRVILDSATDSIAIDVTPGFGTYAWSDGPTGAQRFAHTPGTYTVVVTDANGCTAIDSLRIDSIQSLVTMDLALPSLSAAPGEQVNFPVQLVASQYLDVNPITDFTYDLRFNKTLLVPNDATLPSRDSADDRILTIKLSRDPKLLSGVMQTIGFTATLGDALTTDVTLESFRSVAGKLVKLTVAKGLFTLNGVCPAAGNRLFSMKGALALNAITPNPASNSISVRYGTPEDGRVELRLYDMVGRWSKTLIDQDLARGVFDGTFDITGVAPGRYLLVLRTPTQSLHQSLEVVR